MAAAELVLLRAELGTSRANADEQLANCEVATTDLVSELQFCAKRLGECAEDLKVAMPTAWEMWLTTWGYPLLGVTAGIGGTVLYYEVLR